MPDRTNEAYPESLAGDTITPTLRINAGRHGEYKVGQG